MPFEPRFSESVKQWYSPSGSLLQIVPIDGEQECSGMLKMNVSYTTEGNEFAFYYQVGAAAVSCAMKELDSQTNHVM